MLETALRWSALAATLVCAGCSSPVAVTDSTADARMGPTVSVRQSQIDAPWVHQVTVAGAIDLSAYALPDEHYSMHAQRDAQGEVRGNITVKLSDPLVSFRGDVTCLQVDGHLVWVGVQITKSDAASGSFAEGGSFWFRVQDNGEGARAPADRISFLNPAGGAFRCNEKRTGLSLAFELRGNVQVK